VRHALEDWVRASRAAATSRMRWIESIDYHLMTPWDAVESNHSPKATVLRTARAPRSLRAPRTPLPFGGGAGLAHRPRALRLPLHPLPEPTISSCPIPAGMRAIL
jgi:hypothetical protein